MKRGRSRSASFGVLISMLPMSTDTDPRQIEIWRQMSMQQKLDLIIRIHDEALELKGAWLRQQHPLDDEDTIRRRLRAWQLYGRTDLI